METHTPVPLNDGDERGDSALTTDLSKFLEDTCRAIEIEFRKQLDSAVDDAQQAARQLAETSRHQALQQERDRLTQELQQHFDDRLKEELSALRGEMELQLNDATRRWEGERSRLEADIALWRGCAEAQRKMAESETQTEILDHFLDHAETLAPALAVYIGKADGLVLWKRRGEGAFPEVISKETTDPETYFKPIVVRDRVVATVCARQPINLEPFDFLAAALARSIETFGMKLQSRVPAVVA